MKTGRVAGISLGFFIKVTLVAIVGILLFKFLANRTKISGLQAVAGAV